MGYTDCVLRDLTAPKSYEYSGSFIDVPGVGTSLRNKQYAREVGVLSVTGHFALQWDNNKIILVRSEVSTIEIAGKSRRAIKIIGKPTRSLLLCQYSAVTKIGNDQ